MVAQTVFLGSLKGNAMKFHAFTVRQTSRCNGHVANRPAGYTEQRRIEGELAPRSSLSGRCLESSGLVVSSGLRGSLLLFLEGILLCLKRFLLLLLLLSCRRLLLCILFFVRSKLFLVLFLLKFKLPFSLSCLLFLPLLCTLVPSSLCQNARALGTNRLTHGRKIVLIRLSVRSLVVGNSPAAGHGSKDITDCYQDRKDSAYQDRADLANCKAKVCERGQAKRDNDARANELLALT